MPESGIGDTKYFCFTVCSSLNGRKVGLAEQFVQKSSSVETALRSSLWKSSIAFRSTETLKEEGLIKQGGLRDKKNDHILHGHCCVAVITCDGITGKQCILFWFFPLCLSVFLDLGVSKIFL